MVLVGIFLSGYFFFKFFAISENQKNSVDAINLFPIEELDSRAMRWRLATSRTSTISNPKFGISGTSFLDEF